MRGIGSRPAPNCEDLRSAEDRFGTSFKRHRFTRFLAVGALNTAVGYLLFLIALAIMPSTTLAVAASMVLAVLFNFVTTGTIVFGSRDPARLWRFAALYGLVFLYNVAALKAFEQIGIDPRFGGLLALPGAVAISYTLNRAFVFVEPR